MLLSCPSLYTVCLRPSIKPPETGQTLPASYNSTSISTHVAKRTNLWILYCKAYTQKKQVESRITWYFGHLKLKVCKLHTPTIMATTIVHLPKRTLTDSTSSAQIFMAELLIAFVVF